MNREEVLKRLEALEQNYEKTLNELAAARAEVLAQVSLITEKNAQINQLNQDLIKFVKLVDAIRDVVPSAPATPVQTVLGDAQKVNLTVPQYDVTVDVQPVKFDFKKDDLKSQVLYGIYLTKGRKRLSDVKDSMLDLGYKKAADEISPIMAELVAGGLVQEFDQDKSHKGYRLTPKVIWHFPQEKGE